MPKNIIENSKMPLLAALTVFLDVFHRQIKRNKTNILNSRGSHGPLGMRNLGCARKKDGKE